jgi:glycerate kinase
VVEIARASGLALVPPEKRNPLHTTSYGAGELLRAALGAGAERILVGVGGSATTDGAAGALQALGVRFMDKSGKPIDSPITGSMLSQIAHVDASEVEETFADTQLQVACDVANPLLGPSGAARVFAPQKGASPAEVKQLEEGLANLMRVAGRELGFPASSVAHAHFTGAAGGFAAGLAAFFGAELVAGAPLVASLIGLEKEIARAELVLTGEGRIDQQTVMGKAPALVGQLAARHAKPAVLVGGSIAVGWKEIQEAGFAGAFSIVPGPMQSEQAMKQAAALLTQRVASLLGMWMAKAGKKA